MRDHLKAIVVLVLMLAATAACTRYVAQAPDMSEHRWGTVRSPNTGRCYELLEYGSSHLYSMAISEIPCEVKR